MTYAPIYTEGLDVTNTLQNPFMEFWGRLISFDNRVI
jgi:hypothetical protein